MILTIDIGNTNTVIGCFKGDQLLGSFRMQSARAYTTDEAGILCKQLIGHHIESPEPVDAVVLCSVVPALTAVYENMSQHYFGVSPLTLTASAKLGITLAVPDPSQVGADRLANALAVRVLFDMPAVVVDFGTATTFDVLDQDGIYQGGVIAPGVITSSTELSRRAAQLSRVRIEKPESLISKTTTQAMQSGIYFGTIGQVEHILEGISKELKTRPTVVATGGLAELWGRGIDRIDKVDTNLTLRGLRIFYERQQGS